MNITQNKLSAKDTEAQPRFTPKQQDALNVYGCDVLVSAAAGSGKTFTLTQRIIKNIIEKQADISRILVVTFTRAAASELKTKISSALIDAVAKHPDNSHLRRQLLLLGGADICTIDSFLLRPVKENFEKLGLPATLRLADDAELMPLKSEILSQTLDSFYEKYGVCSDLELADVNFDNSFTDLLFLFSTLKDSSDVEKYLLDLHSTLITSPEGIERLSQLSERMLENADRDFTQTTEGKVVISRLRRIVEGALSFCNSQYGVLAADELLTKKYLPMLEEDRAYCNLLLSCLDGGFSRIRACLDSFSPSNLGKIEEKNKTAESRYYADMRKSIVISPIRSIREELFSYTPEDISHAYRRTSSVTSVLYELLSQYDKSLMAEKRSRSIAEFSDMPRYMLRLLLDENGNKTEACHRIAESFDEIYIDEYQDVNGIQDEIFRLISRNNRFMVGDIKQSIYAFREAEPTCFAAYRSRFPEYVEGQETVGDGATVIMSNNFRSTESVIDFSNTVCAPLFFACGDVISYSSDDDLVFSKKCTDGYIPHKVSVNLFSKGDPNEIRELIPNVSVADSSSDDTIEESSLGEEATFVANEICRLIREEHNLDGSKMRASDISILVRKNRSVPIITRALDAAGIKYTMASKSSLLEGRSMSCLVDLLTVINNPRCDVPLCNVMCCEALDESIRFSMGELVAMRQRSGDGVSLYDSMCEYCVDDALPSPLKTKCSLWRERLEHLRALSTKLSVEKFLRVLAADDTFGTLSKGEEFKILYSTACAYTKNSWNSLESFIRHFKGVIETGSIKGETDKTADAVTITTMHSSKGLQYKACFLFDCARAINFDDLSDAIVYDKELGIAIKLPERLGSDTSPDSISVEKKDNILHKTVAMNMKRRLYQEEMRILYVALTRAEERLYISATLNKKSHFGSFISSLRSYGGSDISIEEQNNMISWVIGTMLLPEHDSSRYTLTLHSIFNNTPLSSLADHKSSTDSSSIGELEDKLADLILDPPSSDPRELLLSSIPAKAAASKATSTMLDDTVFSNTADGDMEADSEQMLKERIELMMSHEGFDSLLRENETPTASERGTAMHLFLQYCDYEIAVSQGVEAEIERLVQCGFIDRRTASILNISQLKDFFDSRFFEMLQTAKRIRREFRFRLFRPASDFTEDESLSELVRDRSILIQGSIDLLIENPDGSIYICDYKTDRISGAERAHPELLQKRLYESHRHQLRQYSYAINRIFGKAPERIFILSLPLGEALEM